jgi:hypothetical protein
VDTPATLKALHSEAQGRAAHPGDEETRTLFNAEGVAQGPGPCTTLSALRNPGTLPSPGVRCATPGFRSRLPRKGITIVTAARISPVAKVAAEVAILAARVVPAEYRLEAHLRVVAAAHQFLAVAWRGDGTETHGRDKHRVGAGRRGRQVRTNLRQRARGAVRKQGRHGR